MDKSGIDAMVVNLSPDRETRNPNFCRTEDHEKSEDMNNNV